jgi:photosystem II stability/assembly factor-like uncharacterized protein
VLVAGEAGGPLNTSVDGGVSWTTGNSPNGIWIGSDMTPTGDRIYAVVYGGGLYRSTDRGVSWTKVTTTSPGVALDNQAYEAISVSADGQRIVASVQNGPIYVSANGGAVVGSGHAGRNIHAPGGLVARHGQFRRRHDGGFRRPQQRAVPLARRRLHLVAAVRWPWAECPLRTTGTA